MSNAANKYCHSAPVLDMTAKKFSAGDLKKHTQKLLVPRNIFLAKPANTWLDEAMLKPKPRPLYRSLWSEGELCILYADANVGKSILAVQIALDIALAHPDRPIIYFDFELSDKQFEARYSSDFKNHYRFPGNFLRAEIDSDEADYEEAKFENLEAYINHSIEQLIIAHDSRILIVDNLTYLRSETEKAKEALPLMKHLKALKKKYSLSILVLAHTPKRDEARPITMNDLQGSKMLINFCDSAFAIGRSSQDKNLRYVKQIKARGASVEYDAENVLLFEITKPGNFLAFTPVQGVHTGNEHEHLKQITEKEKDSIKDIIINLYRKNAYSQRDIAERVHVSVGKVNGVIKEYERSNLNTEQLNARTE